MGQRFCCVLIKNTVDNENEINTHEHSQLFSKLKLNLITKENDMISQGMPNTKTGVGDVSLSEQGAPTKHRNVIASITEKVKKKKKKKKRDDEDSEENSKDMNKLNFDKLGNDNNNGKEGRFQRDSKSDKFFLSIGMKNPDANYFDSFHAEIYLSNYGNVEEKYVLLGSTEEQISNSSIGFSDNWKIDYNFEKSQYIKIIYFNSNSWKTEIIINLALVITEHAPNFSVPIDFYKSEKIIVSRHMLKQTTNEQHPYAKIKFENDNYGLKDEEGAFFLEFNYISMAFVAKELRYKIFRLTQKQINGERQELYCSNERYGKSPIYFNPAYLLKDFIKANLPLFFEFYDRNGVLGEYLLDKKAYEGLKRNPSIISLYDSKNINFGDFKITYSTMPNNHFLDYLNHGLDINLMLGIDYTSSNLDPLNKNSLHTLVGDNNMYEKAIRSCGGMLSYYDKSQAFPVFGFGGIPKGKNVISHCFNVNGMPNPNVLGGLENVIKTYKDSLKEVKLLGPSRVSELIQNVLDNTIKHRKILEQEDIIEKSKRSNMKTNGSMGNFRNNLVSNQIKNSKQDSKQQKNRSTTNGTTSKILAPAYDLTTKDKNSQLYSPARKPFACPSVKYLSINSPRDFIEKSIVSPRGIEEDEKFQRPHASKKTIRNTIFKEYEEVDPSEEEHFIIPKAERNYAILLILTDGKIEDMLETKNVLVMASSYPISVIIIGIGDNNFGNMIELRKLFLYIYL